MYQWHEEEKSLSADASQKALPAYTQEWSSSLVASSDFVESEKYTNPTVMPYQSNVRHNDKVYLGAFLLDSSLTSLLNNFVLFPFV